MPGRNAARYPRSHGDVQEGEDVPGVADGARQGVQQRREGGGPRAARGGRGDPRERRAGPGVREGPRQLGQRAAAVPAGDAVSALRGRAQPGGAARG